MSIKSECRLLLNMKTSSLLLRISFFLHQDESNRTPRLPEMCFLFSYSEVISVQKVTSVSHVVMLSCIPGSFLHICLF